MCVGHFFVDVWKLKTWLFIMHTTTSPLPPPLTWWCCIFLTNQKFSHPKKKILLGTFWFPAPSAIHTKSWCMIIFSVDVPWLFGAGNDGNDGNHFFLSPVYRQYTTILLLYIYTILYIYCTPKNHSQHSQHSQQPKSHGDVHWKYEHKGKSCCERLDCVRAKTFPAFPATKKSQWARSIK